MRHRLFAAGLCWCGLALVATPPSGAQNALGGGAALDGNLIQGGNRFNPSAPVADYRSRNLLVTGNVAGGRGFRGTVGYTAACDFRGPTGSDDLFAQRAFSALSAPNFIMAGQTSALLNYGQYLNEVEFIKATRGATVQNFNEQRFVPGDITGQRLVLDRVAIASTTSAIYEFASDNQIVGMLRDTEGNTIVATASSVMGLQLAPLESQGRLIGLSAYDLARTTDDIKAGFAFSPPGRSFDATFQNHLGAEARALATGTPLTSRIDSNIAPARREYAAEPAYLEILQRIAERQAGWTVDADTPPQLLADLDRQFTDLRDALGGVPGATGEGPVEDPVLTEGGAPAAAIPGLPGVLQPPEPPESPEAGLPQTPAAIAAVAAALRHGQVIEHYVSGDQSRFNELLLSAEQKLADGEYFWAERRFGRALRYTPGHPLATAGMAHAQIGAGLFVPAALTLQQLMRSNPELIDVQFDQSLLPSRIRLDLAITRMRDLIGRIERDRDLRGFLLAYLGHQLDEPALIAEGLEAMDESPMRSLLQEIWGEE